MTFEYQLPKRGRALPPLVPRGAGEAVGHPPRVARLVALAHKLEASVHSGQVNDYEALARLAQVSPARIAQVVLLAQSSKRENRRSCGPQGTGYQTAQACGHSGCQAR